LIGLHGLERLRVVLGRPGLELPEESFCCCVDGFRLLLLGDFSGVIFAAEPLILCRRGWCGLGIGGSPDGRRRLIGDGLKN